MIDTAFDFLLPSWWEVEVSVAAAAFVIAAYWFFAYATGVGGSGGEIGAENQFDNSLLSGDDKDKFCIYFVDGPAERRPSNHFGL